MKRKRPDVTCMISLANRGTQKKLPPVTSIARTIQLSAPPDRKPLDDTKIEPTGQGVKADAAQSVSQDRPLTGPVRWREWKRMLDKGVYTSKAELA